jgi:hypothetical protein
MTTRTNSQQIAELEAKIARLRTQDRALENGQKIILGGMLLQAAKKDPKMAAWVIEEAGRALTRKIDQTRMAPILDELKSMVRVSNLVEANEQLVVNMLHQGENG